MGRILTLVYDFTTATTGTASGTPRPQGIPALFVVQGVAQKADASLKCRLVSILGEPRFTAAQLVGAGADVVSARDAIGDCSFSVAAGEYVAAGPFSGLEIANGAPGAGLGVAGADYGGIGNGAACGLIEVNPGAGIAVKQDFQGATGAVTVLWVVHLKVEMGPFRDVLQVDNR